MLLMMLIPGGGFLKRWNMPKMATPFFGLTLGLKIFVTWLRKVLETSCLAQKNRNCHVYIPLVNQHLTSAHKTSYVQKKILARCKSKFCRFIVTWLMKVAHTSFFVALCSVYVRALAHMSYNIQHGQMSNLNQIRVAQIFFAVKIL